MNTTPKILAAWLFLSLTMAGCATGSLDDEDLAPLKVTKTQKSLLNKIMLKVERDAMSVPISAFSPTIVEQALIERSEEIGVIFDAGQLVAYETIHRRRFARQIYQNVMTRHRRVRMESNRLRGPATGSMGSVDPPEP